MSSEQKERPILDPFREALKMGDKLVQVGLRCAKCKEIVQTGEKHTCKEKTENGDA